MTAPRPDRYIEVTVKVTPYTDPNSVYIVASYDPDQDKTLVVPNPHISNQMASQIVADLKYIANQAQYGSDQ